MGTQKAATSASRRQSPGAAARSAAIGEERDQADSREAEAKKRQEPDRQLAHGQLGERRGGRSQQHHEREVDIASHVGLRCVVGDGRVELIFCSIPRPARCCPPRSHRSRHRFRWESSLRESFVSSRPKLMTWYSNECWVKRCFSFDILTDGFRAVGIELLDCPLGQARGRLDSSRIALGFDRPRAKGSPLLRSGTIASWTSNRSRPWR